MTVNPNITSSVSAAAVPSGAICAGTSVTFTATPTNEGASPTYQWKKDGVAIAGATQATLSLNNVLANQAGNYSVVITNSAGTVTSNYGALEVVYSKTQYEASRQVGVVDGHAEVVAAPNSYGLYNLAQYNANKDAGVQVGRGEVFASFNTLGYYTTSQVQTMNVGAPLLTRDAVTGKFKLTVKAKKSTDLKTFSNLPFSAGDVLINAQGEMEFQFTSPDNAAFFRIESR